MSQLIARIDDKMNEDVKETIVRNRFYHIVRCGILSDCHAIEIRLKSD